MGIIYMKYFVLAMTKGMVVLRPVECVTFLLGFFFRGGGEILYCDVVDS